MIQRVENGAVKGKKVPAHGWGQAGPGCSGQAASPLCALVSLLQDGTHVHFPSFGDPGQNQATSVFTNRALAPINGSEHRNSAALHSLSAHVASWGLQLLGL